MSKIDTTRWTLADEARAQFPAWKQRWIDIIRRTAPMTLDEKALVERSLREMYRLIGADADAVRIVFVQSPMMAAIVSGVAASVWHSATADATDAATVAATDEATRLALYAATRRATAEATDEATYAATDVATYEATYEETAEATSGAEQMLRSALACAPNHAWARKCVAQSWRMRNGGNQWASWCAYLSFVRDVVGWSHPTHEQYRHYEACAMHSGPRYMHPKFCIVSDFPTLLTGYERNGVIVAHNDAGPSHRWADGWAIWHIHGVRVDEQIVMRPETQTIAQIDAEPNEEVRRIRIERFGWLRYLSESGAAAIDARRNDIDAQRECLLRDTQGAQRLVVSDPSTGRTYALGVPAEITTCEKAQAWLNHGLTISHRS